jgi:phospho-N-acetylmuramoyl-pentapeptide-transferase
MFLNDGRISASLLALLALMACLASDGLVANSALTVPLVVAALVSAAVARWGVPKLRQLKLGQGGKGPWRHRKF